MATVKMCINADEEQLFNVNCRNGNELSTIIYDR